MPYPAPHKVLTIMGDAFNQVEEWNVTLRLIGSAPATVDQLVLVDEAVEEFLASNPGVGFPSGRRYLGVKCAQQDTQGRYPDGSDAVEYLRPTPFVGSYGVAYPQIAIVTSLRTARSRGYASNGRMYWPASGSIDPGDGRMSVAQAGAVASTAATLMAAIADSGVGTPAVMSTVGAGRAEPVTGVRVGRVFDTQRRRRNQLSEDFTEVVPVP